MLIIFLKFSQHGGKRTVTGVKRCVSAYTTGAKRFPLILEFSNLCIWARFCCLHVFAALFHIPPAIEKVHSSACVSE